MSESHVPQLVTPDGPLSDLAPEKLADLERLMAGIKRAEAQRSGYKMKAYFPDSGPFRRELYPKHTAFMAAGKVHRERLFMAGNQVGKSSVGAYEMTCHLTGLYPAWWQGHRFAGPIRAWAAGDTGKTVYEIIQVALVGKPGEIGTGMIPAHTIAHISHKAGVSGSVDTIWVRHVSGGRSSVSLKSYEQGRVAFQGTVIDLIWLDEEPPEDVMVECVVRTMTSDGRVMMTFTPLSGTTRLISNFMRQAAEDALNSGARQPDTYATHIEQRGPQVTM